ncbi:MAG: exopolysaccharide biosynthesis protein [Clostridiaceae bacterium]|nr:exopolysaccharide biosynthesis protein [Clostridiaceae bacterium]
MEEISLREIIEALWKGKWIIALVTIIALVLGGVGTYLMIPGSQSVVTIIEINYPGIENGKNPDGTEFDIRQLTSPYVIDRALKATGLNSTGIKPEEVRRNIDINPIVPNEIVQLAETMIKQGKEYVYYPSEFKISYKVNKAFSYNQGIALIDAVIDEYKKYFYALYSDVKTIENAIVSLDYTAYDYPDVVEVISTQIDGIMEFLVEKTEEDANFRSSGTSYTFADLNRSFGILKTVDTSKLESIVNANTLTKDRDKLIKDYEYRVKRMELERAKKNSEAEEARKLMEEFKKEDLVLIPNSGGNELRTENPVSYYNTLAETAITASVEATGLQHEIEYYKKEIERLNAATGSNSTSLTQEADQMIEVIKTKLLSLINLTNKTLDDYYSYKYGESIKQVIPSEMVSGVSILKNMAIALAAGIILGVFIVFARYYWKITEVKTEDSSNKTEDVQKIRD